MTALVGLLRQAARRLARAPGYAALAVATLAVGIAANTIVYNWIEKLLLRPLPGVAAPERLLVVLGRSRAGRALTLSCPDVRDLAERSRGLAGVAAFTLQRLNLGDRERTERAWSAVVNGDFFSTLGVTAVQGRTLGREDDAAPGGEAVVVLSHRFWQRRFAGDPAVVGRALDLNGRPYTVVGVARPGFYGPWNSLSIDLFVPLAMHAQLVPGGDRWEARGVRWLEALARPAPGVDRAAAQADLSRLAGELAAAHPETHDGVDLRAYRFWESPWGPSSAMRPVMTVLGAFVLLLLVFSCLNVAGLTLARGLERRREVAVRLALGASRRRLLLELFAETLLLALAAGTVALPLAAWGSGAVAALAPPTGAPVDPQLALDPGGFLFALAAAVLAAGIAGVVPALRAARPELVPALKSGAGAVAEDRQTTRARAALVVVQVALSVVLLVAAGLFGRSLLKAREIGAGFDPEGMLLASLDLFPAGYDAERGRELYLRLLDEVEALPGVEGATLSRRLPLDFAGLPSASFTVDGYSPAPGEEMSFVSNAVGPRYFAVMRTALVAGRDFGRADRPGAPPAVIVNQAAARRYWPDGDAVGGVLRSGGEAYEVVGVVRDGKYRTLAEEPQPAAFLPLLQNYRAEVVLHVRAAAEIDAPLVAAVRGAVERLDKNLPLYAVKSMTEHLGIAVMPQRLAAGFLGVFGVLAAALAGLGLYGVVAYLVGRRGRELGLRLALGARPRDLRFMVLRQGLLLTAAGCALGLAAALATGRFMGSLLLGVSPTDATVLAAVPVFLAAVALLACDLPARRAGRTDPLTALREE